MTPADLERFRQDVLWRSAQDATAHALPRQWERRALAFESARPRAADFAGEASLPDITAAFTRCTTAARACRLHAKALRLGRLSPSDLTTYADHVEADLRRALDAGNHSAAFAAGLVVDALEALGAWRTPIDVGLAA